MHTRASKSELVEPLPEPERTLNRRLRRRNRKVPFNQRNYPPQHPRIVYPSILDINYFSHFLDILRNYVPMDDEPMWAADHVVAPTPSSAITILETANEFAIKDTDGMSYPPVMFSLSLLVKQNTWLDDSTRMNDRKTLGELIEYLLRRFFPLALFCDDSSVKSVPLSQTCKMNL
ncbi:hypothetical protein Tco_1302424 [Tanacetum coccineum]